MTVFAQDAQLVVPFVSVAAFKAHPTYLDLGNLRSADAVAADQDAELLNILLMASASVESECDQPIQAHIQTDNRRVFADRNGRLHLYPDHAPVRTVLSYSYGTSLTQTTSIGTPACWIEDGRQIIVELAGANVSWTGAMQFGAPAGGQELFTSCTYVAGFANTTMAACTGGAVSITVPNPTGIFAGDTLRIWEPGKEESVVVASTWAGQNTYPYTPATIPLAAGTVNAHTLGAAVNGFDADVMLATVYFAVDGLQRWGTSSNNWPGARVKSSSGKSPDDMSPWEKKACRLLQSYRRAR